MGVSYWHIAYPNSTNVVGFVWEKSTYKYTFQVLFLKVNFESVLRIM